MQVGDRVLIRNVAFQGPHKLADRCQEDVYVVQRQPDRSVPVFELKRDDGQGRTLTLHRNMLLPISSFGNLPSGDERMRDHMDKNTQVAVDSSPDSVEESDEDFPLLAPATTPTAPESVRPIPALRKQLPQAVPKATVQPVLDQTLESTGDNREDAVEVSDAHTVDEEATPLDDSSSSLFR